MAFNKSNPSIYLGKHNNTTEAIQERTSNLTPMQMTRIISGFNYFIRFPFGNYSQPFVMKVATYWTRIENHAPLFAVQ